MARRSASVVPAASLRDMVVARSLRSAVRADIPAEGTDVLGRLVVHFSPFDVWYRVDSWWEGTFMERTVKGAFARTISQRGPAGDGSIRSLFDHGYDFHIGDKVLMVPDRIAEEDTAAVGEGDLLDTSYNRDLMPALRRGGYGSSFMFQTLRDSWNHEPEASDHNPDGLPERTVQEVRLLEFGPVTWPANPSATSQLNMARIISDTDRLMERMARRDPAGVGELRSRIMDLRTATGTGPDDVTPADPAPAHQLTDPGATHSAARQRALRRFRMAQFTE